MEHMSFEAELEKYGSFAYTTVGDSMRPLLRQGKDVVVIERPAGRLKKYDAALYKRLTFVCGQRLHCACNIL